jgi:hypothetical protein
MLVLCVESTRVFAKANFPCKDIRLVREDRIVSQLCTHQYSRAVIVISEDFDYAFCSIAALKKLGDS